MMAKAQMEKVIIPMQKKYQIRIKIIKVSWHGVQRKVQAVQVGHCLLQMCVKKKFDQSTER